MNIYIDGYYEGRMKCDEYLGSDDKSFCEMIDSYRADGCSCQPILGSDHVLDIRDNKGTKLIATCIDEDDDLDLDTPFSSTVYSVGGQYIQVVSDPENGLLLSYHYTGRLNSKRFPVLSLERDSYLYAHNTESFIYTTCEKLRINATVFTKESNIIPLYYFLDEEYRIEILTDNVSRKNIISLYNTSKPGRMKEIGRVDRKQYDLNDNSILSIFVPQIRSYIDGQ